VFDSIVNKTPLSFRTNRLIGGVALSDYLAKLEQGDKATPPIAARLFRQLPQLAPDRPGVGAWGQLRHVHGRSTEAVALPD
jgi:hypothetical protein